MAFPLAGLLRVRGTQERIAAEQLSLASERHRLAEAAVSTAEESVAAIDTEIQDGATLLAMAAARSAGASMLADLRALTEMTAAEQADAQATHVAARRELKGLERLESAHQSEADKADRDREQSALDEIAVVMTVRRGGQDA